MESSEFHLNPNRSVVRLMNHIDDQLSPLEMIIVLKSGMKPSREKLTIQSTGSGKRRPATGIYLQREMKNGRCKELYLPEISPRMNDETTRTPNRRFAESDA